MKSKSKEKPSGILDRFEQLSTDGPRMVEELRGIRCHAKTLERWYRTGLQGVQLEVVKAGGRVLVSRRMILDFFDRLTRATRGKVA